MWAVNVRRSAARAATERSFVWDAATARLLPSYLAGRRRGPLFVTTSLPNIVPAELDRSPDGRGRLSYQRAWSLFREASGGQWTLRQLRHSAPTHLGEAGVSAPLLMAKSRHRDLRTLSRYVRPGTKAVTQLTARAVTHRKRHDPGKHQDFVPLLLGPQLLFAGLNRSYIPPMARTFRITAFLLFYQKGGRIESFRLGRHRVREAS